MSNRKDVLIVDDNPAIVEALSLMLEEAGYSIHTLKASEIVERLSESLPGVLLLDIWMSGNNGRDICKYLKSQQVTQHLPIILISAKNDIQQIAQEAGADDYLAKPFSMKEVVAKVGKYLS